MTLIFTRAFLEPLRQPHHLHFRHRPHPLEPPGGPTTVNATPPRRPPRRGPQRHYRELPAAARRLKTAGRDDSSPTPTPRVIAHVLDIDHPAPARTRRRLRPGPGRRIPEISLHAGRHRSPRAPSPFGRQRPSPATIVAFFHRSTRWSSAWAVSFHGRRCRRLRRLHKRPPRSTTIKVLLTTPPTPSRLGQDSNDVEPRPGGVPGDASAAVRGGYDTCCGRKSR